MVDEAGTGGEGGGLDTAGAGGTSVETGGGQPSSGTPDVPSYSPGSEPVREAYGTTNLTDEPDDDGVFDFFTNLGGTSPTTGAPPAAEPSPVLQPQPAAAPAQVPPAQAPTPAASAAPPAAQPAPAQQPAVEGQVPAQVEAPPGPAIPTVETFLAAATQNRSQIVEQLARDPRFAPTDEQLTLLDSDPKAALASMAANMHYESMVAAASMVQQLVPQLIHAQVQARQQETEVEQAFQTAFPDLNLRDQRVFGMVLQAAQLVKATSDPNATREQKVGLIGNMARMLLGQTQPAAPVPTGRPIAAPFQPARSGGGGGSIPPASSPWDGMGVEFD